MLQFLASAVSELEPIVPIVVSLPRFCLLINAERIHRMLAQ